MKHEKSCACPVCKMGKAMSMIDKEYKKQVHGVACESDNCSVDHNHDKQQNG